MEEVVEGEVLKICRLSRFRDNYIYIMLRNIFLRRLVPTCLFWNSARNITEIYAHNCIVHWLIIRIRMEEVIEGEILKICRLSRFKDLSNIECYVIYFWGGSSNVSCVSSEIQQETSQKHVHRSLINYQNKNGRSRGRRSFENL